MLLSLIVSFLLISGSDSREQTGYGGATEKEKSSDVSPASVEYDQGFLESDDYLSQSLVRKYNLYYGTELVTKKASDLNSLYSDPPYGIFADHCRTMLKTSKNFFFYGNAFVSEFGYLYYHVLGENLRKSNNEDGTEKSYTDFFDVLSLHMACESDEADNLIRNLIGYYSDVKKLNVPKVHQSIERIITSIHDQFVKLDNDTIVNFQPECSTNMLRKYLNRELTKLEEKATKFNTKMVDNRIAKGFNQLAYLGSLATSVYICDGFNGKQTDGDELIYRFRLVLNALLAREERRERYLLDTLRPVESALDTSKLQRYATVKVPQGSHVNCWNFSRVQEEEATMVVKKCGLNCQKMFKEEQAANQGGDAESCKDQPNFGLSCRSCFIAVKKTAVPSIEVEKFSFHQMEYKDWDVYVFPAHDSNPSFQAPPANSTFVQKLINFNIGFKRNPPPNFQEVIYPEREFYVAPKPVVTLDWRHFAWLAGKTYVCTSIIIWSCYLLDIYRFRIMRFVRRTLGRE